MSGCADGTKWTSPRSWGCAGSRVPSGTALEPDGIVWHTSSYSANGGDCVQVATAPDRVLVRDSKDPHGPVLAVPAATWRTFLTTTR